MGGELGPVSGNGSPSFAILAMKDAGTTDAPGTPLQRIQIVKGWIDDSGQAQEQVFDITKKPDNGATVDTATCETSGPGSDSLCCRVEGPEVQGKPAGILLRSRGRETQPAAGAPASARCHSGLHQPAAVPADYATCCDATVPKTIRSARGRRRSGTSRTVSARSAASVTYGKVTGADVLKAVGADRCSGTGIQTRMSTRSP